MEVKLIVLVLVAAALLIDNPVSADFWYNHPRPKLEETGADSKIKCVPGRTIVKITDRRPAPNPDDSNNESNEEYGGGRRFHMNIPTKDESCKMCVCSASGTHEYCSNRPANNVNECLTLKKLHEQFNRGIQFDNTRSLPYRIRRDYIYHNDEIPYDPKAKCFRGYSYYSNSVTANDTDIDLGSEVESLLDYNNDNVCYFCVCSVSGYEVGCIHRDVQYCNFFRVIRNEKAIRDRYTTLLEQDRPTYFRQLSWRMRRTMDSSVYALLNIGGDTLCCNHPDGHRRQIHAEVRNKLRTLKKRLPKENLLGETINGDYVDFIVNNDR